MLTRGSKTAAEKVVRESESPDMGSPDKREAIPPVTDVEDSPLFKYLCNLSPIKPAKSVHHAQTYNELTFPPEPRIFASPRSSRRSSNSSLKRVVAAELLSAQAQAEGRESLVWHPTATNSRSTVSDNAPSPSPLNRRSDDQQVTPCSRRQTEEVPASQSNSAKNESLGNDDYTVEELVGQGMFAMNPTHLNPESSREMERTAATAASFQAQFTDFEQLEPAVPGAMPLEIVECLDGELEKADGTRSEVVRRQSTSSSLSQAVDCVLPGNLTQESKCLEQNDHGHVSMASSSLNEDHGLNFSPVAKGASELDHDTTAMAYFLAGNEALGQDKGEWSEDSSDVVGTSLTNEEAGKQDSDLLDAMASESGLDLSTQNRHNNGAIVSTENANHQQSLLFHRADTVGQRGFRRRCLDFDASGARRKSLGSMGTRKSLGSRLKDCSGTTVADGNNASPVLGNVIPATSDATTSRVETPVDNSSNANDTLRAESDSGTHTRGAPACGDTLGAMTKTQQLSSCSYENNVDVLNAKTGEAHTQISHNTGVTPAEGVRRSPRVRRTGIGLHLNSLTTTMSFKRDYSSTGGESAKRVLATSLGLQPLASTTPKEDSSAEGLGRAGHPAVPNQGVSSLLERRTQVEINSADAASLGNERVDIPTPDFNIENLPPLEESLALTPIPNLPRLVSPRGQKRSQPHQQELIQQGEEEATDELLDSPQSSKRRRLSRRKSTASSQGEKPADGCKRCNCKKSKCLKLYCECFAAGIYCVGSCACRHCFNKPEYEDTVRNTRLQIESRNPLAFAPKIVQTAEASPIPGDEALDTPASARHKRGCNCKKSLCLKKYCECFQAGVGCSEGCRCEGCKNMYGKKEGPAEGEEKEGEQAISSREESQVEDPIELLNRMSRNSDRLRDCAKPNVSPITPTFEHDGHGRSMLRLRSTGRKRISSDEHCASPLAPHVSKPPKSPTSFSNTLDSFDLVPHPQGDTEFSMNGAGDSPMTTPTFARIGHVSSRWGDGLTDLCTLTPLPLTTLQPTPGSSCVTTERPGASPAFSSQRTESPHHAASSTSAHQRASSRTWSPHSPRFRQPAPRSPLRFDTARQSQVSSSDQLTPPMQMQFSSSSQVSGKSLQSELESVKVVAADNDDGIPDFLKYPADEMSSPSRSTVTTKSCSPKQKRVTPPRHVDREQQQEVPSRGGGGIIIPSISSSPGGLRNSKRFILQALPPVPPTPSFPNG